MVWNACSIDLLFRAQRDGISPERKATIYFEPLGKPSCYHNNTLDVETRLLTTLFQNPGCAQLRGQKAGCIAKCISNFKKQRAVEETVDLKLTVTPNIGIALNPRFIDRVLFPFTSFSHPIPFNPL
jgi:hypothetical protein